MAITYKQNEDLQKQYDLLRSQGQTKEQATGSIKSTLQGSTTTGGANVYETLKNSFNAPEPTVKINTDVMRTYNPDYNPDVPTSISGTLGTKPTDSISQNNQALSSITPTNTGAPVKTPLQLAQEETARKQAELDKRNQEFTVLENKGATSELGAGVIPGMSGKGNAQTDILSSTSQFLQTNLKNELANLDAEKQKLQESIKTGALSAEDQKTTLQPYEQFLDKVTKLKDINEQQIVREQADLKDRYNTTIDRQRKANELALINAQKISAITGVGFTSGGIQGINNIIDEGNQAIGDLEQERESMLSKYKDADAKLDIEYLDTITTIQAESKKALQDRYNSVITQIQKIDAEKGKATKEGLLAIKDVAKEYFDTLDKQWEKDYKMMDFNYKKLLDYKKDVREQESVTRDQQKDQLALLQKGDLTSLSDEDIMNLGQDMDLDNGTIKGLILVREQQKKDALVKKEKPFVVGSGSAVYDPETGTFKTPTQTIGSVTPGTTQNRPDRNNNPGNIKAGDVGYGVDDQNHTIFGNAEEGYNAMVKDITAKLTGNTRTGLGPTSTLAQLGKVYAEDPNWANSVSRLSGYPLDTKLSQIDVNKLAPAIAKQEGFTGSISTSQGGAFDKQKVDKFVYSEKLTPNEQKNYLQQEGLLNEYLSYNSQKQQDTGSFLGDTKSIQDITFPEKTTEFKTKSYNYGTRMDDSNKMISMMEDKYKDSWTVTELLSPRGDYTPNFLKSSDRQQFEQAQRNFINAVLRQESGAVIADSEFDNARKQYFPSPGDSEEVMNQKKKNRELSIQNMLKSAGKDEQGRDISSIWKELRKNETLTTPSTSSNTRINEIRALLKK